MDSDTSQSAAIAFEEFGMGVYSPMSVDSASYLGVFQIPRLPKPPTMNVQYLHHRYF